MRRAGGVSRRRQVVRAALALLTMAAIDGHARRMGPAVAMPTLIEFDACALPGDDCPATPEEEFVLVVDGAERRVAVTRFRVLRGNVLAGRLRSEMATRPVRLIGSRDLLRRVGGTPRVRIRAATRTLGTLMLESVEPFDADAE